MWEAIQAHEPMIRRSNGKSAKAAQQLRGRGFSGVPLVEDGMAAWQRHGFAIETAAQDRSGGQT
ncbi:MAG: hypothetical protein QGF20_03070 [Alphaproteobacteria bacterium]|jgi:rhodanese-related sulfurtransferase|nr:hypothetical protein [Alphaproteobacteria bacterium]